MRSSGAMADPTDPPKLSEAELSRLFCRELPPLHRIARALVAPGARGAEVRVDVTTYNGDSPHGFTMAAFAAGYHVTGSSEQDARTKLLRKLLEVAIARRGELDEAIALAQAELERGGA